MAKNADPILNPDDIIQKRWQYYADADRVILTDENGDVINSDNPLATTASLTISGDIQIGAVEIKDGITDKRASVDSDGSLHVKLQEVVPTASTTVNPSGNFIWTDDNLTEMRK